MRSTSKKARPVNDRYLALIHELPLRPIRSEAESIEANGVLTRLLLATPREQMDAGESDYVEALTALIQQYERKTLESLVSGLSGIDVVKHLMEERRMNVSDLGKVIGHQPTASQILKGDRDMSKSIIRKLSDYFGLSPSAFMR